MWRWTYAAVIAIFLATPVFAQVVPAAPSQAEESRIGDAVLRDRIQTRLANDARVRSFRVNVETVAGNVTLRGVVKTLEERGAAVELALATPGIRGLRNEIVVVPARRLDGDIRRDALGRVRGSSGMPGAKIVVGVQNQIITVNGTFATLAQVDDTVSLLMGLEGVRDIRVAAAVAPAVELSDDSVRTAVAEVLMADGRVDASGIKVGVSNGVAVLEGTAPTLFQLVEAGRLSRKVGGVKAVRNQIGLSERAPVPVG